MVGCLTSQQQVSVCREREREGCGGGGGTKTETYRSKKTETETGQPAGISYLKAPVPSLPVTARKKDVYTDRDRQTGATLGVTVGMSLLS